MKIRRNYSLRARQACAALALGISAAHMQGCASGKGKRYLAPNVIAAAPHAAVTVTNYSTEALRVYVVMRGVENALGTVASLGTRIFQLPMPLGMNLHEYRLVARTRSGAIGFQSAAFSMAPGQIGRWQLSPMQGATVYVK